MRPTDRYWLTDTLDLDGRGRCDFVVKPILVGCVSLQDGEREDSW